MAEERISVHICSNKCRCLREISENFDVVGLPEGTYCAAYIHDGEYNGLSRTEAVERMARALYAKYEVMCNSDDCPNDGPTCEGCPIWKKYEEMSSAALDALVGDKK